MIEFFLRERSEERGDQQPIHLEPITWPSSPSAPSAPREPQRPSPPLPRDPAPGASAPQPAYDLGLPHHTLISSRFGPGTPEPRARDLQQHLVARGINAKMVNADAVDDFGTQTMALLTNAEFMVAMGSADYAEKTTSMYSSYYELRFAHEHRTPIIPIKLCSNWPPSPPGDPAGADLCRLVFGPALVYIDCSKDWDAADVAQRIATRIRRVDADRRTDRFQALAAEGACALQQESIALALQLAPWEDKKAIIAALVRSLIDGHSNAKKESAAVALANLSEDKAKPKSEGEVPAPLEAAERDLPAPGIEEAPPEEALRLLLLDVGFPQAGQVLHHPGGGLALAPLFRSWGRLFGLGLSVKCSRNRADVSRAEAFEALSDEVEVSPHGIELSEPVELFLPFAHPGLRHCPGSVLLKAEAGAAEGADKQQRAWQEVPDAHFDRLGVRCKLRSFCWLCSGRCKTFFNVRVYPDASTRKITITCDVSSRAEGDGPSRCLKPGRAYVLTVRDGRDADISDSQTFDWICSIADNFLCSTPTRLNLVLDTSAASSPTTTISFFLRESSEERGDQNPFWKNLITWPSSPSAPSAPREPQRPGPPLPRDPAPGASAPQPAYDLGLPHRTLISSRFGPGTPEPCARDLQQHLVARGINAKMVNADAGDDFGTQTMALVTNAEFMVAMGSADYAEKTTCGYCSYFELKYAYERRIPIIPIKLCSNWPPSPPGDPAGADLCRWVFGDSLRYIDCSQRWNTADVAQEIATKIRRDAQMRSVLGNAPPSQGVQHV